MRALCFLPSHAGVGLQAGMGFQATAFSSPIRANTPLQRPPPPPLGMGGWLSSPPGAISRTSSSRRRPHRPYASLFDSGDENNAGDDSPNPGDADSRGEAPESKSATSSSEGGAKPVPRADEQMTGSLADAGATGEDPPQTEGEAAAAGEGAEEEQVDWDKAWASTRQRMEREKRAAPAFSGRKQVVATKNEDGGYDFEEISADGSSRMRGDKGRGGFGFADSNQVEDGPGSIRRKEQEAVNLATTNQAFAGLFAILLASLIFEVYVFMSGGITNGSTRFQDIGQPTTYDALPLPATPPTDLDLVV
ncbi:unnamed protein product [Ectocarpus sp. 12 AP-2014]